MGFRFRRRITLGPGLRINLSKAGASVSVGPRGASLTSGPSGTQANLGLPGTGISYQQRIATDAEASTDSEGAAFIVGLVGLIGALVKLAIFIAIGAAAAWFLML